MCLSPVFADLHNGHLEAHTPIDFIFFRPIIKFTNLLALLLFSHIFLLAGSGRSRQEKLVRVYIILYITMAHFGEFGYFFVLQTCGGRMG